MKISQLPYVQDLAASLRDLKYIRDNPVSLAELVRALDITPTTAKELVMPLITQRINAVLGELTTLGVEDA